MKTRLNKLKTKIKKLLPLTLTAGLLVVGCSIEKDDIENDLYATNQLLATPVTGKIYTIQNLKSGLTLDIDSGSNSNGANLQLWGNDVNTTATHRQWEIISVGDDYVRLKGVDSGKSLEVSGGINSNGTNVQQWAYQGTTHQEWEIISVGDGYYRLKNRDSGKSLRASGETSGSNVDQWAYNGWTSQKWFFTEIEIDNGHPNPNPNPPTNPEGESAGAILGLTNDTWKLNGFIETPSASATYYDNVMDEIDGDISTWSNNNYFYEENGWAYFKCYRGLGSSENSGNPRVELRELNGNGNLADWDADNETHSMQFDVRVDQLPIDADNNGGVLCFAQIHGPSGTNHDGVDVDDLIRLQFIGDSNQSSGAVRLKISGYITEEVRGGSVTLNTPAYNLDTAYTFKIEYSNGIIRVYEGGSVVFEQEMDTSADGNYFKLGNYLQSVQGAGFTGSYGLVGLKNLIITHPNNS